MEVHGGYAGNILEIDLSAQRISRTPLPTQYREQLLGGKALAAQVLFNCMTGRETALSEENPVVIAAAPLTGTGAPGSSRFDMASLSAKDDLPAFSNCGGDFGLHLKRAGYDLLILKGKCDRPRWLEISGETVIFHDAANLWGMGTGACRERLKEVLGKRSFGSLCIGPAGEHLVKFASVMADGHSTGRAGLGAVLGWKHIKAITLEGNKKIPLHDPEAVLEVNQHWYTRLRQLALEESGVAYCTACPLHCVRHSRGGDPILEELGMDAIAAETAAQCAAAQGMNIPDIYRAIAFRQGVGDRLAEGVDASKGKGGKRRNVSYVRIMEAFALPEDAASDFCKNLTEAVSVCGQCMFTVNALRPGMEELPLLMLLKNVTGKPLDLQGLLTIGAHSRNLEQTLRKRFEK